MAALRAAEMLRSFGGNTGNPLNALLSFLQPLLEDRDGQRFDPKEFAAAVRAAYGWNFTEDVADGFRRSLRDNGWLKTSFDETGKPRMDEGKPVLVVACPPRNDQQFDQPIDGAIERITSSFKTFLADEGMPVAGVYSDDDHIITEIVWHLVESFGQNLHGGDITDGPDDHATEEGKSDQRSYQVGRFVRNVEAIGGAMSADFERIAAVGLLAELAQDFAKPTTRVEKSKVAVYLDSPIAHDLLGISGMQTAEQTRSVITRLKDMGASISIFDQSIKEMKVSLWTILNKDPVDRYGAIQDAFLSGELSEAYVHSVVADPVRALRDLGVQVKNIAFQNALKPDHFFSNEQFHRFCSQLVAAHPFSDHRAEIRSRHDANATAYIMRLRKGHETDDLFETQHFFLTRNATFTSLAREFCVREDLLSSESVGPFVNMYDLAASVWLRTGLYERSMEIPRRRLLAGCERVLAIKRPVVVRAQRAILELRQRTDIEPEQIRQVEAILGQDRARMLIADRVRGAGQDIDVDDLLEIYRRVLADEELKGIQKGRLEVAEDRDRISRAKSAVEEELARVSDEAEKRETDLGAQIETLRLRTEADDAARSRRLFDLFEEVNREMDRFNRFITIFLLALALMIFFASFWKEFSTEFRDARPREADVGAGRYVMFGCAILPALVLIIDQVCRLFGWERPIRSWIVQPWAKRRLLRKADERGLFDLLGDDPDDDIRFENGFLVLQRT